MLGYAFLSSPTMRDAVQVALRYFDLSFAFGMPRVSLADGQVRLAMADVLLPPDVAGFLVARDLAAIHTVIGELVPGGVPLTGLRVRVPAPADTTGYEAVFGLVPEFGAGENVATVDAAYLDQPLPLANSHTVALCEAQCRDLVSRRRSRTGGAHDVREVLTRLGYAEASSFIHAFKRWKGVTPSAFIRHPRRGATGQDAEP